MVAVLLLSFTGLNAQIQRPQMQRKAPTKDVSEEQLQTFAKVASEVQKIQRSSQANMRKVITDEGLDMKTFSKISRAQRSSDSTNNDFSKAQMAKFRKAQAELMEKQKEVRQKIYKKIEEEGMNLQEYKQIARSIQNNPELKKKFRKMQQNPGNK